MATEAENWLESEREYFAGVQLLRELGASDFIIDLLKSGPDAFNTGKLVVEMQKQICRKPAALPVAEQPEVIEVATDPPGSSTYVPDKNLDKKLRIDGLIKQLWKEVCHLHGQLCVLPPGEQLHQVARAMKLKNLKRQDMWDHLHYFNMNGQWFDELPENQPKPFDCEQEIKNLMANRSKASAHLKKPLTAARKKFILDKIARLNEKIDQLKKMRDA